MFFFKTTFSQTLEFMDSKIIKLLHMDTIKNFVVKLF